MNEGRLANVHDDILTKLARPFHPSRVVWKPGAVKGERALALAYADVRAYMDRLDEVCGTDWSVTYTPWGDDKVICHLTIGGVMRSSTGESTGESERNEIGGTVAEAQSFKRACTMFGLGRYLYLFPSTWVDYDPKYKQFTDKAKAKLNGIVVTHFRRTGSESPQNATDAPHGDSQANGTTDTTETAQSAVEAPDNPFDGPAKLTDGQLKALHAAGRDLYGDEWDKERPRLVEFITAGAQQSATELTPKEAKSLISGMQKRIDERNEQNAIQLPA